MAADHTRIYEDLKRQYDLVAERRKTLTSQATSLIGFAGIIETILIATIVAVATDADVKAVLSRSPLFYPLLIFAGIGFGSYIVTVLFSLRAFWEPKWIPAPAIPLVPGKDRFQSISYFWNNLAKYNLEMLAQQLGDGIDYDQKVNNQKYNDLKTAFLFLICGIIASAIGGILFLIMAS